jgi:hypothetical protein
MTFVMWILGALVASAGTTVYVEFGTVRECVGCHVSPLISPGSRDSQEVVGKRPTWNISIADQDS